MFEQFILRNLPFNQVLIYSFFSFVSLFFIFLWASFFLFYSPKKTTPKKTLFIAFLFGICASYFAFLFENLLLSISNFNLSFLTPLFTIQNFRDFGQIFIFSLFFTALIEELIKFIILKKYLEVEAVNQVIDGLKIGLWFGFGFVFIENIIYFLSFYSKIETFFLLITSILLRGIFSTLAHALYGAIMGYYLSLAKFNKFYQHHFLRKGFLISFTIHGFFNLFLIINLGFLSILILISFLIVTLIWYNTKKNLEVYIFIEGKKLTVPPLWAERIELETLLSKRKASADYFRQLLKLFPPEKSKK